MKYIRTKDYVFRVAEDIMLATSPMRYAVLDKKEDIRTGSVSVNDVIKKADTIEELCDEFVLKKINQPKPFVYTIYFTDLQKYAKDKDWTIYGAIWTDKGLIYVAKMNEKGELELL